MVLIRKIVPCWPQVSSAAAACGASGLADAYNKACSQLRESAIAIAALRGDKQTD